MAKKPDIDPEAHYKVRLKRVIRRGRVILRPGEDITLKGAALSQHLDDVLDYTPA